MALLAFASVRPGNFRRRQYPCCVSNMWYGELRRRYVEVELSDEGSRICAVICTQTDDDPDSSCSSDTTT